MIENPQIIRIVSSDHNFLDQEYDEYADSTARSIICFRTVAVIVIPLPNSASIFYPFIYEWDDLSCAFSLMG